MDLCKYKNAIGEVNTGVHKYKDPVFNLAIVDVLVTILGGVLISYYTNYSLSLVLIYLFVLGIILHKIFCVKTTVDKFLFSDN
jgi:hypothetical protein